MEKPGFVLCPKGGSFFSVDSDDVRDVFNGLDEHPIIEKGCSINGHDYVIRARCVWPAVQRHNHAQKDIPRRGVFALLSLEATGPLT